MEVIQAQMKWREKVEAENRKLKEELELLRSESAVLSQALKEISTQRDAATNTLRLLFINDHLMENRGSIIRSLQAEWEPKREAIFGTLWKQGRVVEFKVMDIFLYQTNVISRADFLWVNPDGSGGFGRINIWMDPLNEFALNGSSIQEQMRISAQELVALREGPPKPAFAGETGASRETGQAQTKVQPERLRDPPRDKLTVPEPLFSEETKTALTAAGITAAGTLVIKAGSAWIEEFFKKRAEELKSIPAKKR